MGDRKGANISVQGIIETPKKKKKKKDSIAEKRLVRSPRKWAKNLNKDTDLGCSPEEETKSIKGEEGELEGESAVSGDCR